MFAAALPKSTTRAEALQILISSGGVAPASTPPHAKRRSTGLSRFVCFESLPLLPTYLLYSLLSTYLTPEVRPFLQLRIRVPVRPPSLLIRYMFPRRNSAAFLAASRYSRLSSEGGEEDNACDVRAKADIYR